MDCNLKGEAHLRQFKKSEGVLMLMKDSKMLFVHPRERGEGEREVERESIFVFRKCERGGRWRGRRGRECEAQCGVYRRFKPRDWLDFEKGV